MKRDLYFVVSFYDSEPRFIIEDGPFTDPDEAFECEKESVAFCLHCANGTSPKHAKKMLEAAINPDSPCNHEDLRLFYNTPRFDTPTCISVNIHGGGQKFYQVVRA